MSRLATAPTICLAALALSAIPCSQAPAGDQTPLPAAAAGAQDDDRPLNQPPEGFTALFNGEDLTNWRADGNAAEHWSVQDGILVFDGQGQNLVTERDYGDFELLVDWKIEPQGDSGIYLRGNPQVQIWDNPIGSGGLYNNENHASEPLEVADNPPGQWNTFRIIMRGDRVTVYLNDVLVVDDTPLENYFHRGEPLPERGPIELQNHGNTLYFRNIYVRELDAEG